MMVFLFDLFRLAIPAALFLCFVLGFALRPAADGAVLVIANPFAERTALALIAESHGRILAKGATDWIAVGTDDGDGLFRPALAHNALLLLAPGLAGCRGALRRHRS